MWIVRIVYTSKERDMVTAEFIVGFEHPRGTTLYYDEVLWRIMILAGLDPDEWFMKNQSNDFGGVMYKKSAEFALRSKGLRRNGGPLRDCGTLHDDEQGIDECSLYWPPVKLFNGRHQKTCMSSRDHKRKRAEQYHFVAPNVYHAAYVAEFHSLDQVPLTRGVVLDVCSGSQSATHAMDMLGVSAIPMDARTRVDTGWGMVHNERLELNAGFAHDPGVSAYDQFREVCHAKGVAMGRTNAVYVSIDCKPNIMNAQAKGLYRDKRGRPLPGADGDLARDCDDQLLDFCRCVKRMDDERKALIEQRDRDDSAMDADFDAPIGDGAERHETQQAAHCTGSSTEEALPSMLLLGTTLTEGLHVSTLGSASSPNLSSIDAVRATGDDEGGDTPAGDDGVDAVDDESNGTVPAETTTLVDYADDAEVEDRQGAELGSQRETPTPMPDTAEQQNDTASRVTGWCNGDSIRNDGSMAFVDATTLGHMPHGRWQSSTVLGMSSGISWEATPAVGTGRGWTARTFTDNNGTNIGMTRFRPTDMVHVGTGEELVLKLTGMMPGTRVERRTSSSGVTSHLARSSRRIDMSPVLASVGLNVTNTNAMAHHMLQSFITNNTTLSTTPTHRDENNAILIQLRGSKEVLVHPPTQSLPGCSAEIFASATLSDSRWLDVDPFGLSRAYSSKWVKVVMVPGDVVVMPKLWWHAVRSTPGSVAISVPVQLDEIDERESRHRTCRRDMQPVLARRGAGTSVLAEEPPESRRADYSLNVGGPVAHFYALTDPHLAAACRIPYERVEGRVVAWNTDTGLATSAVSAAAELGVSAQHTRDLMAWMTSFQRRPTNGGAVLAAPTDENDEQEPGSSQAASHAIDDEDGDQVQYSPADAYNEAGDLRVYTQPLRPDGRPKNWSGDTPRHAIHDAVDARVASCMDLGTDGTSYETLAAFVTHQHDDGTCTVRLADDLLTVITRVHVRPSRDPVDADTRDRLLVHARDMHDVAVLYTERGARVQRRGSHRMYGKRYSMDVTGDGAGTRALKRKLDCHQDAHENLCHDDGTHMNEEEQVAKVMELSELDGAPSMEANPTPAKASAPAPQPKVYTSPIATAAPRSTPTNTITVPHASDPEVDDIPDVEVVPAPPKPPIEMIDITDDNSEDSVVRQSARGVGGGDLGVQPAGNLALELHSHALMPPRPTPHSSLLRALRDNVDHPVRRPQNANLMIAHEQYSRRPTTRQDPGSETETTSSQPGRSSTAAQRAQWGHIEVPLCLRDWHKEANQQYAVEMANKRRRTDGGSYRSNGHVAIPSQPQGRFTCDPVNRRLVRAPAAAPAEAPRETLFEIVDCSETAGQLCSTRGCYRPRRHYRINLDCLTSESVCCPTCAAPPIGLTPVMEYAHSEVCNCREADRVRRWSMTLMTHVSRHSTAVARVNDGSAGGSARSHNDD